MRLQMKAHNHPGYLFVFCGLDGSGKTTQIALLEQFFSRIDMPAYITKQPTDAVRSSAMFRTYMDSPDHSMYDYRALSLLCASDRVQHTNRDIVPKISQGRVVISDRYFYSCLANLRARGYVKDRWICEVSGFIPKPDVAFFIDVEVDTAISRVRSQETGKNRFIDIELQYRLREQYLDIARENGGVVIDGSQPIEEIFQKICSFVMQKICKSADGR